MSATPKPNHAQESVPEIPFRDLDFASSIGSDEPYEFIRRKDTKLLDESDLELLPEELEHIRERRHIIRARTRQEARPKFDNEEIEESPSEYDERSAPSRRHSANDVKPIAQNTPGDLDDDSESNTDSQSPTPDPNDTTEQQWPPRTARRSIGFERFDTPIYTSTRGQLTPVSHKSRQMASSNEPTGDTRTEYSGTAQPETTRSPSRTQTNMALQAAALLETLQHEGDSNLSDFNGLDSSLGRDFSCSEFQVSGQNEGYLEAQSTTMTMTPSTDILQSANNQWPQQETFPEVSDFHYSIAADRHMFASAYETQLDSLWPPCMPDFGGLPWQFTSASDPTGHLEPWQSSQSFNPVFDYDSAHLDAKQPTDQPEIPLMRGMIQRPTPCASIPCFENDKAKVTHNAPKDNDEIHVPSTAIR